MVKPFIALIIMGSSLLLASCSDDQKYLYEIPDDSKESYELDCGEYCRAQAACLAVAEDSQCTSLCPSYRKKGAFQSAYLDGRAKCVESLDDTCQQQDLDACRDYAFSLCQDAGSLDTLLEQWCSRWLECNGSPVDRYLQRCLSDLEANPDRIILTCLNAAAVDQFHACVQAAECEDVVNLPLLTLCSGVYR